MNEKTLQAVLKENHERYVERKKEQDEREKKEQRKELIIVVAASMLILGLLFKVLSDMTEKEVNNCMNNGYSYQVCMEELG